MLLGRDALLYLLESGQMQITGNKNPLHVGTNSVDLEFWGPLHKLHDADRPTAQLYHENGVWGLECMWAHIAQTNPFYLVSTVTIPTDRFIPQATTFWGEVARILITTLVPEVSFNVVPMLHTRSSWARKGLEVLRAGAGFGDVGFGDRLVDGKPVTTWTLEPSTLVDLYIPDGERVAQMSVHVVFGVGDELYDKLGKYWDQTTTQPAKEDQ